MADIYRKSALERISSPEQMDKTITVTSPMSWLALGAVILIAVVTLVWSIVGTWPVTVTTVGVVTKPTGTNAVYAPESGKIVEISVPKNQIISAGEVLAQYSVGDLGERKPIIATQDGVVTKIMVTNDSNVNRGDDIVRFTPAATVNVRQVIVCYVSQSDARKLQPGMKASVSLQSADSQTYGHMEARIVSIDASPATDAGMSYVLGGGNGMSTVLKGQNSAVVAVTCQLGMASESQRTKSGYWWSNERGREKIETVADNALVNVNFVVEEERPIFVFFTRIKKIWAGGK